jgi:tetratricopeptide (TPR) repeat protein
MLGDRHLAYFLNLAEATELHLIRPEQIEWLPVLDADYENLRLAFEYALSREKADASLRLCKALGWFWKIRCYWLEGLDWSIRALGKPVQNETLDEKTIRARTFYTRAMMEQQLGYVKQMQTSAEASLTLALENSNEKDIAIAKYFLADALLNHDEQDAHAFSLLEQCFAKFQELNEPFWQAYSFLILRNFLIKQGLSIHDGILRHVELARNAGERLILADSLSEYAYWLFRMNQVGEAKKYAEESDSLYKQIDSEKSSLNSFLFADIAWGNGDTQRARTLYMELYQRFSLLGEKGYKSNSAGRLGLLAMEEGDLAQARAYLEEALLIEREAGWKPWEAYYLIELGNLFYLQGNVEQFRRHTRQGFALKHHFSDSHKTLILMTILGSLFVPKPESSALLLGGIDIYERNSDSPRSPVYKRYFGRAESHIRKTLGDMVFEYMFAQGQKMSLDETLDLALKTVEEI